MSFVAAVIGIMRKKGEKNMSENIKLVLEKLEQSPEIKAETEKNPPKTVDDLIAIAARLGVELTKEELQAEVKQMSLEDADLIAGGDEMKDEIQNICGGGIYALCIVSAGSGYWLLV